MTKIDDCGACLVCMMSTACLGCRVCRDDNIEQMHLFAQPQEAPQEAAWPHQLCNGFWGRATSQQNPAWQPH